jgi:hypothetical protein
LGVNVKLPSDVRVYSPGVIAYLPAIKERIPVLQSAVAIARDLKVNTSASFRSSLGTDAKAVTIRSKLESQACDTKICYLPASVPIKWQLPLDWQHAPANIRHK